jgi:hypothetical protein
VKNEDLERFLVNTPPVDNELLCISKMLYGYLKKLAENLEDKEIFRRIISAIEDRIDITQEILDEYEFMQVSDNLSDLHEKILTGFDSYYQGLLIYKEFLQGTSDQILVAFDYIYLGDKIIFDVEETILSQYYGPIFSTMGKD